MGGAGTGSLLPRCIDVAGSAPGAVYGASTMTWTQVVTNTYEFWFKVPALGNLGTPINLEVQSSSGGTASGVRLSMSMAFSSNRLMLVGKYQDASGGSGEYEAIINGLQTVANNWYHFVMRFDSAAGRVNFYAANVEVSAPVFPTGYSSAVSGINGPAGIFPISLFPTDVIYYGFGAQYSGVSPGKMFSGKLAEFRIWSTERSDAEINANNASFVNTAAGSPDLTLQHAFRFNEPDVSPAEVVHFDTGSGASLPVDLPGASGGPTYYAILDHPFATEGPILQQGTVSLTASQVLLDHRNSLISVPAIPILGWNRYFIRSAGTQALSASEFGLITTAQGETVLPGSAFTMTATPTLTKGCQFAIPIPDQVQALGSSEFLLTLPGITSLSASDVYVKVAPGPVSLTASGFQVEYTREVALLASAFGMIVTSEGSQVGGFRVIAQGATSLTSSEFILNGTGVSVGSVSLTASGFLVSDGVAGPQLLSAFYIDDTSKVSLLPVSEFSLRIPTDVTVGAEFLVLSSPSPTTVVGQFVLSGDTVSRDGPTTEGEFSVFNGKIQLENLRRRVGTIWRQSRS